MEGRHPTAARKIFNAILGVNGIPIILTLALFAILCVLFRMKSVEQDYKYNELNSKIENQLFENKELKARKARLLSIDHLRTFAHKFMLEAPREDQIIIVP